MKTKGWKNVFKFTFIQGLKQKSFLISTIVVSVIIMLMVVGINIVPALAMSEEGENGELQDTVAVKTVYLLDETKITDSASYKAVAEKLGISVSDITADKLEETTSQVKSSKDSVLLHITMNESSYYLLMSRPESEEIVSKGDCDSLLSYFEAAFEAEKFMFLGVSADNVNAAMSSVGTDVTIAGEAPQSVIEDIIKTVVPMASSLVLFMLIFIYGQMVAQSVAIEKTSRVMELLLTSIRPLAVIIGKVLAMGLIALIQFFVFCGVGAVSFMATAPFGIFSKLGQMAQGGDIQSQQMMDSINEYVGQIDIFSILLIIIVFMLGFLFYALIAGLIGASISRMEDLSAAMQPLAFIGVIGFYLAYFPSVMSIDGESNTGLQIFSRFFPLSSPFSLPSAILMGEMSLPAVLVAVLVLAIFVMLMAMLVAKVYEQIVLHTGNRLKIKDIFSLAKNK